MGDVWRQFKVLFWKNCIIQIRNPKGNISNKPTTGSTVGGTVSTCYLKMAKSDFGRIFDSSVSFFIASDWTRTR